MAQNMFTVLLQLQSNKYVYQCLIIFWASLKTSEEKEQGVCIFAWNLGKDGVETYATLKYAFRDEHWSRACAFKSFTQFNPALVLWKKLR